MKHKLGICIPYRNRKEHLDILIPKLSAHLDSKGIEHAFYVAHQNDDKLFNRGAMKNIAAKHAFEDGCDYIAWHDVDMLPSEECDYSYPEEHPIHIATQLSKYNYGMSYPEYFGGVVLFTKEQVIKTNGYSNDYWDWGMEDDDLFWRCKLEGYCKTDY
jgi:predicted glycosyltransferase involved in capsule biosynthesis